MKKSSTHNTMDFTRRRLLLGLAAAPFFFNSAWAAAPKNPEVVIIGSHPELIPIIVKKVMVPWSLIMDVNCRFSWLRLHIISTGRDRV